MAVNREKREGGDESDTESLFLFPLSLLCGRRPLRGPLSAYVVHPSNRTSSATCALFGNSACHGSPARPSVSRTHAPSPCTEHPSAKHQLMVERTLRVISRYYTVTPSTNSQSLPVTGAQGPYEPGRGPQANATDHNANYPKIYPPDVCRGTHAKKPLVIATEHVNQLEFFGVSRLQIFKDCRCMHTKGNSRWSACRNGA